MNYFTLFDLPETFNINKKLLSKNFYKLQLQFHPDLFMNDSTFKKKMILEKSIEINKGYKILKNFSSRAIYFLSLRGFKISKETVILKNHSFLIEYFSFYEELENLKKNNFDEVLLNNFLKDITTKITKYQKLIELEFNKKNFKKATIIIEKLLFFEKIKENLKNNKMLIK
ncbi:Fe-S protein assembly co-chaperone HscB [Buchnera aphidicola]|uniref:Co-chaperone protein HscB n=1 Tax=Buchnera aphidicola (Lipaphis pseudobrassicae) TaxID=1258543 RepID=A0A4D6Y128_9GAMM|nr:Fe-S protein assembly co-chaperone HscB [Buchnera aphidicola]QCI22419.1 Fe-S protein assembly co-chaperone HscB [Buchnera aphidicola (Lipaphis pseudobrassicae)]